MIGSLFEGIESLRLPCSWVLLIPAAAITVFARRRTALVVSVFVVVATSIAWIRFAGWWFETPRGAVQIVIGVVVMVTAALAWRFDRALTDVLAAAVAGVVAVWAWIPCVGPELAEILNNAQRKPFSQLGGTIGFFIGLLLPFILIAASGVLFPRVSERLEDRRIVTAGALLLGLVGLLFATTLYDNVANALFRVSEF